jgi:chemosensory pili system protein ChpA (sensor histidine kinase/response regulator)
MEAALKRGTEVFHPGRVGADANAGSAADSVRQPAPDKVKVDERLMDDIGNSLSQFTATRNQIEHILTELAVQMEDMREVLDRASAKAEALDAAALASLDRGHKQAEAAVGDGDQGFDALEMDRYTEMVETSHGLVESLSDVSEFSETLRNHVRDMEPLLLTQARLDKHLQEALLSARMVPFTEIAPRFETLVRQVSAELDKSVNIRVAHTDAKVDRQVMERLMGAMEHLIRNAMVHGIEDDPALRSRLGKPEQGQISISFESRQGEYIIDVSDDGQGVNLAEVRKRALQNRLLPENGDPGEEDLLHSILLPGLSTAEHVSEVAGRGVGLDVVNEEVRKLGGSIQIDSRRMLGTRFTLHIPFSRATNLALIVEVRQEVYAMPLGIIEGVVRINPLELEVYYQPDPPPFEYAGQRYPLNYLGTLLHPDHKPFRGEQIRPQPVILIHAGRKSLALQVDRIIGNQEIVERSLPQRFQRIPGVSGGTILPDGRIAIVLDPLALARARNSVPGGVLEHFVNRVNREVEHARRCILVVDDSLTMRKVAGRTLQREGYRVELARDGVEALEMIDRLNPDLVLMDLEMPRLNGFEVVSQLRRSEATHDLPVVVMTSRIGDKHREAARELGVHDFIGKPFQDQDLLSAVSRILGGLD